MWAPLDCNTLREVTKIWSIYIRLDICDPYISHTEHLGTRGAGQRYGSLA